MAEKNNKEQKVKKVEKPLVKLNSLFNDLIDNIIGGEDVKRDKELNKLEKEVDSVIYSEIKSLTDFTGNDISTFLVKLFNDQDSKVLNTIKSIEDIFNSDNVGALTFLNEKYRNINLLYEDLNTVANQLYELKEALLSTRDAILSSDELSHDVSRTIKIKNSFENEDNTSIISIIENLEQKFSLLEKIKSHIVPNTLQYGKYYVYTVPYSKLFEDFYKMKTNQIKSTTLESVDDFIKEFKKEAGVETTNFSKFKNDVNETLNNIKVYNDDFSIPILEGTDLEGLLDEKFKKKVEREIKNGQKATFTPDGTVEVKGDDFSFIKDCFIKLIDPRKIIPIKILEETIGYYYIHESDLNVSKSPFTTSIKFNPTTNTKDVEQSFLSKIVDKIVKSFDKKFLENNKKFKDLILNSLMYNNIYKKQIKFQFIPKDYITEFHVNRNEEGEGVSIILPSLFYAKLYLALLIFKMISIITKSNDTRVHYVKSSGLDQDVANAIQTVARSIKERQINFTDLLNYNSMVSKIGQHKDVFMPVGPSGEKGIEFDILSGQDIQLNTELLEMLRTAFINATGVPSVIMNYVNEADYAKTLVMANAKFLGRVVSYQLDFNKSITELYRKIIRFSTDIPVEIVEKVEFFLNPPKSLSNTNMTDLISNTDQIISFIIKAMTGENASPSDEDNTLKDILYKKLAKELLPMIPWEVAEKLYKEAQLELRQKIANKEEQSE